MHNDTPPTEFSIKEDSFSHILELGTPPNSEGDLYPWITLVEDDSKITINTHALLDCAEEEGCGRNAHFTAVRLDDKLGREWRKHKNILLLLS